MVTPYYVSWHVDYQNYSDVHTIKTFFSETPEQASEFFENLGECWAKRLVLAEGSQTFSDEWAVFIPGGQSLYKELYVIWYQGFDEINKNHSFKIKYFDVESDQTSFYYNLIEQNKNPQRSYEQIWLNLNNEASL
jgi:hypothetical protein